jgi:hypothetical protein
MRNNTTIPTKRLKLKSKKQIPGQLVINFLEFDDKRVNENQKINQNSFELNLELLISDLGNYRNFPLMHLRNSNPIY